MENSDEHSEDTDRDFSSLSDLNESIEGISSPKTDEKEPKTKDIIRYPTGENPTKPTTPKQDDSDATPIRSDDIFDDPPPPDDDPASQPDDDQPKGQTFDVSQFSICEVFDHAPSTSRRKHPKPYDYNRFSEDTESIQNEDGVCFDYVAEDEDARRFERYSIGEILEGAPDSKKPIADVRFRRMEAELSNLLKQCSEKDEYIRDMTRRLKDSGMKAAELRKHLFIAEKRNEELSKNLGEAEGRMEKAQVEAAEAKARVVDAKSKSRKKAEADWDRQMKQVVSQHERRRAELEVSLRMAKEKLEEARAELEDSKTENKLLSRQKGELFSVVSKQMKLVANLRRQILHLRAGVLRDFTEEEIRRAVQDQRRNN